MTSTGHVNIHPPPPYPAADSGGDPAGGVSVRGEVTRGLAFVMAAAGLALAVEGVVALVLGGLRPSASLAAAAGMGAAAVAVRSGARSGLTVLVGGMASALLLLASPGADAWAWFAIFVGGHAVASPDTVRARRVNGLVTAGVLAVALWAEGFGALFHGLVALIAIVGAEQAGRRLDQADAAAAARDARARRFERILHALPQAIVVRGAPGVRDTFFVSDGLTRLLGYDAEEAFALVHEDYIHPDEVERFGVEVQQVRAEAGGQLVARHRLRHRDGRWMESELHIQNLADDPDIRGIVLSSSDVTESSRRRADIESQLSWLAYHDALTSLPNRRVLLERIREWSARGAGTTLAVLYCDLDGFKPINDRLGHAVGDAVLIAVARRLRDAVRDEDVVARVGGDEFVVIVEDDLDETTAEALGERLVAAVRQPIAVGRGEVRLSLSVGILVAEMTPVDPEGLLRAADGALYAAKRGGRDRVAVNH